MAEATPITEESTITEVQNKIFISQKSSSSVSSSEVNMAQNRRRVQE